MCQAANINKIAIISSPVANITLLSIRVDETTRYANPDATRVKMRLAISVYMKTTLLRHPRPMSLCDITRVSARANKSLSSLSFIVD